MAYASIARPDHWLKNVFMLIGVVLAFFYKPALLAGFEWVELMLRLRGDLPGRVEQLRAQRNPRRPDRRQPSREAEPADSLGPRQAAAGLCRVAAAGRPGLSAGLAGQRAVPAPRPCRSGSWA